MTLAAVGLLAAPLGCKPSGKEPPIDAGRSQVPQVVSRDHPGGRADLHSAIRCGECHGPIAAQWSGSAHASASRTALYQAMRAKAPDGACDRCHSPLLDRVAPGELVASEGVTCELCHGIKGVVEHDGGAVYTLGLDENIKYGPHCDVRDNYFHKVGCSPLHAEARVCSGCHQWSMELPAGGHLAIFTEYDEWLGSGAAKAGIACQDCHMPGVAAEIALGSPVRASVSHHGLLGRDGALRRAALSLALTVDDATPKLRAAITLTNVGAGHKVPTGLPGRQVVLRVRVVDPQGREIDRAERIYARVLVDEGGVEVPFYAATREASDDRLGHREARQVTFLLEPPAEGEVLAEVSWRELSPKLAESLGQPAPREIALAEARVGFGKPRRGGGRAMLPRTVVAGP